ncbi:MAG TPA: hypothetical protein DCG84_02970, partial [Peptococcaceae bacterium]|nr:hypothetical protein [Peptococcaceae bacterium]
MHGITGEAADVNTKGALLWSAYFVKPCMGSGQDCKPYVLIFLIHVLVLKFYLAELLWWLQGTTYFYLT